MIPGITVANRTNPSQDPRVSIRGFGARSAFGVRSVRVIRDGMPLTLPDGQTPLDYLDLESVGRIDVIRGTASALYGNASGGVIDIRSSDPFREPIVPEGRIWFGADNLRRTTVVGSGTAGKLAYQGNVGRTEADNYRDYSRQRLTNGFGRVTANVGATEIAVVGLVLDMPLAENPGALTAAQYNARSRNADPFSVTRKARKEVEQLQVGVTANRNVGRVAFGATVYGGTRSLFNPIIPTVIEVDRSIAGASLRGDVGLPWDGARLTIGGDLQLQDDDRKNWANCNGVATASPTCPSLQEKGVLTADQQETVLGGGPYAQLLVERGRLRVNLGARTDAVRFKVEDRLITGTNPDDSGQRTLRAASPMAGVAWRATQFLSFYGNYATAFETPTTTELANQPDGSVGGFNESIDPQRSATIEGGAKGLYGAVFYSLAAFRTRVRDELIGQQISGDRSFFRNAGRTARDGVELELTTSLGRFDLAATHAFSSFRFVDYSPNPSTQLRGKRIPGIPMHHTQAAATARFARTGFVVVEGIAKSRVWANDANADSAFARAYQIFNARTGYEFSAGGVRVAPVVGVNNALGTKYVSSVAINATGTSVSATKFFEPGPRRTWIAGARVWYR
jgi:iron complex outermembrane receptor protein